MPAKSNDSELIPADDAPTWNVVTTESRSTGYSHELRYGRERHAKGSTPNDLRKFREMADFMNARSMKPKTPVECLADEVNGTVDAALAKRQKRTYRAERGN